MGLARAGNVVLRRIYLLVLGALCIGTIAYFWSVQQPVWYDASSQVVVTLRSGAPLTPQNLNFTVATAQFYASQSLPDAVIQTIQETVSGRTPEQLRNEVTVSAIAGQPRISINRTGYLLYALARYCECRRPSPLRCTTHSKASLKTYR